MHIFYTAFDVVPSPKGAGTHITQFVRGLVGAGHQVHLMTASDGVLPAEGTYEGATINRVAPPNGTSDSFLARAIEFGQAVHAHVSAGPPYDIVHFRSIWDGLHLVLGQGAGKYQTLFEVNGLPSIELKYHYPGLADTAEGQALLAKMRTQEMTILAGCDAIVCPSDVTRTFLVSLGAPRARITVIPNGVQTDEFCPSPLPPREGRLPTILYVGTLAPWQGLDVLLAALPQVLAKLPVRLVIAGRGRSRQLKQLHKQALKLGIEHAVTLAPAVPHHAVPGLIAQADVCVAPLVYNDRNVVQGCCPIKVIEYMASSRPIVAANLPVVRELVREDVEALLHAPDDSADLARQVVRVLQDRDLAEGLAARAARRARERFTWHRAQARLLRVYEGLVG